MKKSLLISLALLVAAIASAAEGFVIRSAAGPANPTTYFPALATPPRIVSYDATGAEAADTLAFAAGTTRYSLLVAAGATDTNLIFGYNTLASNDVVLFQNATGAVVAVTSRGNVATTNKTISLRFNLGTNLTTAAITRELTTNLYSLQCAAADDATTYYIQATNGLAANDALVLYRGPTAYRTGQVASVLTVQTNCLLQLRQPLQRPVTIGDSIYEITTNYTTLLAAAAADATSYHVASTNIFVVGTSILFESATGLRGIAVIDTDGVGLTNIVTAATAGIALAAGDRLWRLSTIALALFPGVEGATALKINQTNALVANDPLVIAATGYNPERNWVNGTPTNHATASVTLSATFGVAALAGQTIREGSTTINALTFAANEADRAIICNGATNLAAGDSIVILSASGGVFDNTIADAGVDYPISTVTFTSTPGLVLAAGDYAWLLGAATSFPIGAAHVTRDNPAGIWAVNAPVPIRARLTSTNGTIHNLTALYP